MQYYIHADDFGRDSSRNSAIDTLLIRRQIQRTTLMVNMSATEEAVRLADTNGYRDKVGFHLNLSSGTPLTEAIRSTPLCSQGRFCHASHKRFVACMTPSAIRAIRAESEAQMRLFRQLGFHSAHMDSHDWVLYQYPVLIAVRPLLKKYGFETTRIGCENWIRMGTPLQRMYRRFMSNQIAKDLRSEDTWSGGLDSLRRYAEAGKINENTRAEIMTHPKTIDGIPFDVHFKVRMPMDELLAALSEYGLPNEPVNDPMTTNKET